MSASKTSSSVTSIKGDIDTYITDVDNDLSRVFKVLRSVPNITTGSAAPTTTPSRIGNIYVDTTNKKLYMATGHSSSADWIILN